MRRPVCVAALCVGLAVLTAACSSEPGDFCSQGEAAFAQADATGALGDDPEAFAEAVHDLRRAFDRAEPPAEIAADWAAIGQVYADLDETLDQVDLDDSAAFEQALTEFADQAESDELDAASDAVSTYFSSQCAG